MNANAADTLCSLIDQSPSPYHAVETAVGLLTDAEFVEAEAGDAWPGTGNLFVRRGGSLVAWRQPSTAPAAFALIGAHTDSPNLRVKPNPDHTSEGFRQLNVEVYGGVLWNSWLDRDLGLSGRLVVKSDGGPRTHLFRLDDPVLRIPQLAIHLDREVNTKGLNLNPQDHLKPVWSLAGPDDDDDTSPANGFASTVAEAAGVDPAGILGWDVMVHDLSPSTRSGRYRDFVTAPRLDNLCSSFMAVSALCDADAGDTVPVICLYDHEEIGSTTVTGADSVHLAHILERIVTTAGGGRDDFLRACTRSLCLSADMAHATHPNYADRHDGDHPVRMGEGVVIKVNANQRYASDAESIAAFAAVCEGAGVPTQSFVSRNDMPCGSTIGPVTAARLGMATVDVGIAQLAMHSAREMCGAHDVGHLRTAMTAFLS